MEEGSDPGTQGWYAFSTFENFLVVYGGNSNSNDWLNDIFLLSLEEP
jgi:hypothetical protein